MQFAYIHDSAMHYVWRDAGRDKPVVIFINSLGTDMRSWHDVQAQLGDAFSTLTYDKRGHGLSGTGTTPYSIEALSADLIGLMEHLAIGKVIICGLSVGGLIAQRPDLVAGLVLSNTAHKIGNAQMWNDRIRAIEENGLASILNSTMPRWFTAQFRSPKNAAFAGYCNMFIRQSQQGYTATCAALRDADFTSAASETVVPTLCIVGDQDGATPPDLVRELAQLIPGAHFRQITDSGHIPCVEQPAIFANLLREFIQTIEYGGQADG